MSDHEPLTEAEEAEIEARCAAATPGPWFETRTQPDEGGWPTCVVVAATAAGPSNRVYASPPGGAFPSSDKEFIAHARQDVPRLLAEVRRLRAEIETRDRTVEVYRRASQYWWIKAYDLHPPTPTSSDQREDDAIKAMVRDMQESDAEIRRLRERLQLLAAACHAYFDAGDNGHGQVMGELRREVNATLKYLGGEPNVDYGWPAVVSKLRADLAKASTGIGLLFSHRERLRAITGVESSSTEAAVTAVEKTVARLIAENARLQREIDSGGTGGA